MGTRGLLGTLAFFVACTFVAPANAANIGGTDFALFGKTAVKMEDSAANPASPGFLKIEGNVGVNDVGGLLRIGKNNIITGTAIADNIFFGQGASVGTCVFNNSTGVDPATVCGTIVSPAPAGTFPIVAWPPLAVPVPT